MAVARASRSECMPMALVNSSSPANDRPVLRLLACSAEAGSAMLRCAVLVPLGVIFIVMVIFMPQGLLGKKVKEKF